MSTTVKIYKHIPVNGDRAKDDSQNIAIHYTDKFTHKIQSFTIPLKNISTIKCCCGKLQIRWLYKWFNDDIAHDTETLEEYDINYLYSVCTELVAIKHSPNEFNDKLDINLAYSLNYNYQKNEEKTKKEINDIVEELTEMLKILDNIKKDPLWKTYEYSYIIY